MIRHRFLCGVFSLSFVFANGELDVMFTEQPENTTAQEGTTTTFSCAVNNTVFEIVWYINDTDASYTQQRGVRIIDIDQTSSQLEVNASQTNNNSYIHCTAFQFVVPPFNGFPSEKALLRVEAGPKQQANLIRATRTHTPANHSTRSLSLSPDWIGAEGSKQQANLIRATRTHTPPNYSSRSISPSPHWIEADEPPKKSEQQRNVLIALISVPIVVSVLVIVCITTVVILARRRGQTKDQTTTESFKMTPNMPYEYQQPMRFKFNVAYDDVKLHTAPSPHPL